MKRKKLIRMTAHSQTLELLKGQIGFLQNYMDVILVAKDTGNLRSLAKNEGVQYHSIEMHREISPLNDLKSLFCLIRFFKHERPDIVHANTPKGALLGLLAAKLTSVPTRIYNINGLRFETATGIFRYLLILMEKLACACATKVIPQSNGIVEIVKREHITKKPLKVIRYGSGNGVDVNYFNPELDEVRTLAASIRGDWHGISFVFVGRLVGDKGVNELVEAFDHLCHERRDVRLHLVGPREEQLDPLNSTTINLINSNDCIIEHGKQKDVRPFLAASDVLLLPSYREGFPNVVLEASAMGLPCIVSNVNGATDAIKNEVNGLIIPKRDSTAIYRAMQRLASDSNLRQSMASIARSMVKERFSRPDVWQATLEMYQSL